MKKKLTLWIFLLPLFLAAQDASYKNGTITFDFHKKPKPQDTVQKQQPTYSSDDDEDSVKNKRRVVRPPKEVTPKAEKPDYARDGLFNLLFHAGINACQIDGDGFAGYRQPGAEFGLGTMIKVHPILSVSMELNYTMKGARQNFVFDSNATSLQKYQVQLDYVEVPFSLNIHTAPVKGQKIMFINIGLAAGVWVRYKEFDQDGDNVTGSPPDGQPHRFELSGFGGLYFVIHKNFAIGGKFQYSITRIRGPRIPGITRLLGEYNNDITVDFMYIMNSVKKNGKKSTIR